MSRDGRNWGLGSEGRERLGANVAVRRLRAGLTRRELAIRAAVTTHRLAQIEDGKQASSLDVWVRLGGTTGDSLDDLLAGVRWVPVPGDEIPGEGAYIVRRRSS